MTREPGFRDDEGSAVAGLSPIGTLAPGRDSVVFAAALAAG